MVTTRLQLRRNSSRLRSFTLFFYYIFEAIIRRLFIPESWQWKDVHNQVVLITGAGSGIGRLMAIKFATLGARLVLWDVNGDAVRETAELVKQKQQTKSNEEKKCFAYEINLTEREAIYRTADRVRLEVGPVDILINNAGVVSGKFFLDIPDELLRRTMEVNTLAHMYTIKAFLPGMIEKRSGHIVTIASALGNMAGTAVTDYCASKYANVGFEMALRLELAQAGLSDRIRTTIVKPSKINTGMFTGADPGMLPSLEPETVADRIVSAIRANRYELLLPSYLWLYFLIFLITPFKALVEAADFAGMYEAMLQFRGRASSTTTKNSTNGILKKQK